MTVTTDVVRKVYIDSEGVCIKVGPDGDALGLVDIRVGDEESAEYFGNCNITVDTRFARALASAILNCCEELERANR